MTLLVMVLLAISSGAEAAKNVILMIADGQGWNTVQATEFYAGGPAVYRKFPVQLSASTWSASNDSKGNPKGYDPIKAWTDFFYVKGNATDSAAAATALNTGVKVLNGRINWGLDQKPVKPFSQLAAEKKWSTGAITTVMFSHATPAGVAAHNVYRENYSDIANEMIYHSDLDVIMGCGHPLFDSNGKPMAKPVFLYVGGEKTWTDITDANGANGFTFIETKEDFEKLADGKSPVPAKVIGTARIGTTLQQSRLSGNVQEVHCETFNKEVPDLATMTRGALRVLHQNPNGFYLMIEGGAIDWANHANQKGRMIEEEMDFNHAVQAVVAWVEKKSNWNDTLLIVTADHETGHLWGSKGYFFPITFNGVHCVPGMAHNSGSHTNSLVPLFAKGKAAEAFANYAKQDDPVRGPYVDNTDVFKVMRAALVDDPTSTPGVTK